MTSTRVDPLGYVSIIGLAYFQPIVTLIESLQSFKMSPPNEVQASYREYGYAASIVILLVVCLESILNLAKLRVQNDGQRVSAAEFFATRFLIRDLPTK